jgi:hypothetical protein
MSCSLSFHYWGGVSLVCYEFMIMVARRSGVLEDTICIRDIWAICTLPAFAPQGDFVLSSIPQAIFHPNIVIYTTIELERD